MMTKNTQPTSGLSLLSLKTAIRTKDFDASKKFYTQVLGLPISEEYSGENRGCIVRLGEEPSNAFLEISEIPKDHYYHHPSFLADVANDKMDLQIRTDSLDYWATKLAGTYECRGPIDRPWGSRYLYLRDPDGIQVILYEEQ